MFYDKIRAEEPEFEDMSVSTVIYVGYPAEQILRQADKLECDVIVMGTHGYNILKDALIGGTARKVVRNSEVPVMVIRLPKKKK